MMLKQVKKEVKNLKEHMQNMAAYRAAANEVTLGFLDALEEQHQQELNRLQLKVRLLSSVSKSTVGLLRSDDIARAKLIPISNFLKVPPSKKVKCLFHDDKEASMHIYECRYHCFSCGANDSTIGLIMKLRSCTFVEAVRFLLNK